MNSSLKKLAPWLVIITLGISYFSTMFCTNSHATVSTSCFRIGMVATNFVKSSWKVSMYLFPLLVTPVAHLSKGWLAVVVISMGALRRGLEFLFSWQLLHHFTYCAISRFIFGHSYLFLISLNVLFMSRWPPTGES